MLRDADRLLVDVALLPLAPALLEAAETIEPDGVATLDAIHLASAVRISEAGVASAIMTYDITLADAAREHGLSVVSP